jgi:hypothetical protein
MIIEHGYYEDLVETTEQTEADKAWEARICSRNTATRRVSAPCRGCGYEHTETVCANCGYERN